MIQFRKYRKRFFIFLLVLITLLAGGLLGIMHFYGDEVKQSLLAQVNDRLEVEISVEEIQLDLFTNFPRGSLLLKGINSREKLAAGGNSLLKAGQIDLLFNLMDIFRGTYKIEKINLEDAFLNLLVLDDGNVNYRIFRDNPSKENATSVNLKKVRFKNVVISYIHLPSQQEYLFRIDGGDLEGTFSAKSQLFHFDGSIYSSHIKSGRYVFLEDRNLMLDTEITIDNENHMIRFMKGDIHSEGLDFRVTGNVLTGDADKDLSLAIMVERSSLSSLEKLIPAEYLEPFNDITLNGDVEISATIEGNFTGNRIPRVNVGFSIAHGEFKHNKSGFRLSGMKFDGSFTNGEAAAEKTYSLLIKNMASSFEGGTIEGSMEIQNFSQPRIHTNLVAVAKLGSLADIIQLDTLESISGLLEMNLEFRNQLKNFRKFTVEDFISSQTAGTMKISNMQFRLKESPHDFREFNGNFHFNNKDLKIDEFSGFISGSDFKMEGYFRNILAYAFKPGESIYINADFHSDNFNLDRILETGKGKATGNTRLSFSERVNYNLNIQIDKFTFRKFTSTQNEGRLIQRDQILYVQNTRINSMDGRVIIDGSINGQNSSLYSIDCKAEFKGVNIEKLFRDFGNFGQLNLTSDHLRGSVDARVNYTSTLTPSLFVDQRSVFTLADVEIYNGELIGYQPLNKLSKYVKRGELEHVKFSALKNKIKIENEVVFIPEMDIESSSMNLTLYGEHKFNNDIDYHVQLLLSEIISRKQAADEDLGENFAEDDGLGKTTLYLSMTGSAEDPVVKYDSREVKDKISADLRKERGELRKIFREEFGKDPGKTDDTDNPALNEDSPKQSFTIDWDETKKKNPTEKSPVLNKTTVKKEEPEQKDFIIQWDEQKDTIDLEIPRKRR